MTLHTSRTFSSVFFSWENQRSIARSVSPKAFCPNSASSSSLNLNSAFQWDKHENPFDIVRLCTKGLKQNESQVRVQVHISTVDTHLIETGTGE